MSLFSKFKEKKNPQADISPESDLAVPLTEPPSEKAETAEDGAAGTMDHLMRELNRRCIEFPDDIKNVEGLIPDIIQTIHYHMESIELYDNWKTRADEQAKLEEQLAMSDPSIMDMPDQSDPPPAPSDAEIKVFLSADRMTGYLYCLPPVGDGRDVDEAMIDSALAAKSIQYGIDREVISGIAEDKVYCCIYPVARGTRPVNGQDGQIIDHFARSQEIHLNEDEKGIIDYKNLQIFKNIKKGDIICDLIAPKDGQDGQDVTGKRLAAVNGRMPAVPRGKNTCINEEGTALIADIDGDISFQKNVFRVEPQLTISGNVDSSTGNIDFVGDVLVTGDVQKGFKINAGGNIVVYGMAEGAVLTSGEDIDIKKGMNGSGSGTLTAEGDIRSRFLEQTNVSAKGSVIAETIINCHIVAGEKIEALTGKGIIIGGSLAAEQSVEARRIGNLSNIRTVIKLGHSMQADENVEYLVSELKKSRETLEKINKNVSFLQKLPAIPPDKKDLYHTITEQKKLYESKIVDLESKLNTANNKNKNYAFCHVQGDVIYSITEISLNYSRITIQDATSKCKVYYSDGELVIGTF